MQTTSLELVKQTVESLMPQMIGEEPSCDAAEVQPSGVLDFEPQGHEL